MENQLKETNAAAGWWAEERHFHFHFYSENPPPPILGVF
jgi:hypothetical protein